MARGLGVNTAEDEGGIGAAKAEAVTHDGVKGLLAIFTQNGQVNGVFIKGVDMRRGGQEAMLQHEQRVDGFV